MIDIQETIRGVSILSFLLYVLKRIKNSPFMALSIPSPPPPQSFPSENKVTITKLEKQISGENGVEKSDLCVKIAKVKGINMARNRPSCLVIPEVCPINKFVEEDKKIESQEIEVEGLGYYLANRKGRKYVMEDSYGISVDISNDPKQALFSVIDGHGGRAAADYVSKHLAENIVEALKFLENNTNEDRDKEAINEGYLATDTKFLSQELNGGACVASVLVRHGHLHVANVGDCRVVLSRNGVAHRLTTDHRLSREDERQRIENTGGYVHCRKGIWRVNGSLAVSRAIGDRHLKKWVISIPDIHKFPISSDCEFLILASDGLWDMVNDQEAVDVVAKGESRQQSCKKLIDISFSRGNKDDVTVMIINLQHFAVVL